MYRGRDGGGGTYLSGVSQVSFLIAIVNCQQPPYGWMLSEYKSVSRYKSHLCLLSWRKLTHMGSGLEYHSIDLPRRGRVHGMAATALVLVSLLADELVPYLCRNPHESIAP